MKKTCKTCAYNCNGECGKNGVSQKRVTDFTPACEHWALRFSVLSYECLTFKRYGRKNNPKFFDSIVFDREFIGQLKSWHRQEPDNPSFDLGHAIDVHFLNDAKARLAETPSLMNKLNCLVVEFCKYLEVGDFGKSITTGGEILATMVRALNEDGNLKKEEEEDK